MRKSPLTEAPARRLVLQAETALDLMVPHPFCLPLAMTIREAGAALVAARVNGASVVDESGRPVGVLSQTDVLRHHCGAGAAGARRKEPGGFLTEIMTPAVFSVRPRTPAGTVVDCLLAMEVQQLFVMDEAGALIGAISGRDILRHLRRESAGDGDFLG
jgi:CBS domain-containing protein